MSSLEDSSKSGCCISSSVSAVFVPQEPSFSSHLYSSVPVLSEESGSLGTGFSSDSDPMFMTAAASGSALASIVSVPAAESGVSDCDCTNGASAVRRIVRINRIVNTDTLFFMSFPFRI